MATQLYIRYPFNGGVQTYPTLSAFPATANAGSLAIALDTGILYEFFMGAWIPIAGSGTVLSVGTLDGQSANANGATINANVLFMQSASASFPGLVNTSTQSFAGSKTFLSALSMNSQNIINLLDPTTAQMAATKNYVDNVASGLQPIQAAYAATVGSNLVGTYSNGAAGIGATLTITATGAFTLDGTTPPANSRILIKDQTSGFQNGVYDLTVVGSVGVSPVLTRSADYNTNADMNAGNLIPVINGTVNATTSWLQTAVITAVGVDSPVFVEWSYAPANFLLNANNLSDVASRQTSLNNLAGSVTAAQFLRGDGTNILMSAIQVADVPTLNQSTTGTAANITASSNSTLTTLSVLSLPASQLTGTGNLTETTSAVLTITGGTGAVIGSGASIQVKQATTSQSGYLTDTDWNTFNGKQAAGAYLTSVAVASSNGFTGSSSGGTTPTLTLTTSITGVLKGNGTAISAATSGTDYSAGTSALATGILKSTTTTGALTIAVAGDFPTLNQSTTGTAANITASSNSTLMTLSALTSAASLATVGTIGTGVWNGTAITVPYGGTGNASATAYMPIVGGTTTTGAFQSVSTSGASAGYVLTYVSSSAIPTWQLAPSAITNNYFSGTFANAASWSRSSASLAAGTNSGGNTLTTIKSNGLTVTAAASNVCGVTWTPSSSTAVYRVNAVFGFNAGSSGTGSAQLVDGSGNAISPIIGSQVAAAIAFLSTGDFIFAPASTSPVTIQLYIAQNSSVNATIEAGGALQNTVGWSITQIQA